MKKKIIFALILILLLMPSVFAVSEGSLKAESVIATAEKDMNVMVQAGLPAIRYNDSLIKARQFYEVQLAFERNNGTADYSSIYDIITELNSIKLKAFKTVDELTALKLAINETIGIDLAPVLQLYDEAKAHFEAERYEESLAAIDNTYKKIAELEALQTKIKVFYDATSATVTNFLKQRWKELVIIPSIIFLIYLLTNNKISCMMIEKKMKELEGRRSSIKSLIAKTQKMYFEKGGIGETNYRVRMKEYSGLIREINRQIPLLREELEIRKKRKI